MSTDNDHLGGEEPDLDLWLADLSESVSDNDTAAFLRPYKNWDGQEPLGDYVTRVSKSNMDATPISTSEHAIPVQALPGNVQPSAEQGERDLRRAPSTRNSIVNAAALPPSLLVHPVALNQMRAYSTQEQIDGECAVDEGTGRWSNLAAALVAAALMAAVAIGGSAVLRGPSSPIAAQPSQSSVTSPVRTEFGFTYPAVDARVASPITIQGTAKLAPGRELWLLISGHVDDSRYYVINRTSIAINSDNRWTARLEKVPESLGAHPTSDIDAIECLADGELDGIIARRPTSSEWTQLSEIPKDCILLQVLYIGLTN